MCGTEAFIKSKNKIVFTCGLEAKWKAPVNFPKKYVWYFLPYFKKRTEMHWLLADAAGVWGGIEIKFDRKNLLLLTALKKRAH